MIGEDKDSFSDEEKIRMYCDGLLKIIINYNPYANVNLIKKAINVAYTAHKGQMRASGEGYIIHPIKVAKILTGLKADTATICAAFLHDVVEDTSITIKDIEKEFGIEIANLVQGVTKIEGNFQTKEDFKAENLRKVLLASSKDIRVMLIKLADRLHNMQTLKFFREDKQKRIAQETLDIYAPIAEKLGIWRIKGELEDLSLKFLEPEKYQLLKDSISEKREIREKKTQEYIKIIKKELAQLNIDAEVYGRAKYFYSIYKKMQKFDKTIDEIYDLLAIRIIVKNIPDCYVVLNEVILKLWKIKTGRLKDYIKDPKENGYQSIHATVSTDDNKLIEVQIRTKDMHIISEDGVAAHWKYKDTEKDKYFDRKISWMKQILDWMRTSKNNEDFVENVKINLFENEIMALTPKGDPISLPVDATPVDFAYEVHTNIGNKCHQAKINGKIVSLDTAIKPGDIVEIITKKESIPSRQWLKFVKSSKAKSKIRSELGLAKEKIIKENRILSKDKLDKKKIDEYTGDLTKVIEVLGKKAPIKISKCCNPKYGDIIRAFYTKDGKITVHKGDCSNIFTLINQKETNIFWIALESSDEISINIKVKDRHGIFAEILDKITEKKIKVMSLKTETEKNDIIITLRIENKDKDKFEHKISSELKKIDGILSITIGR